MTTLAALRFVTMTVVVTMVTLIHQLNCARILVTGVQLKSHMLEQLTVAEELVSRGHDVYYGVSSRYEW